MSDSDSMTPRDLQLAIKQAKKLKQESLKEEKAAQDELEAKLEAQEKANREAIEEEKAEQKKLNKLEQEQRNQAKKNELKERRKRSNVSDTEIARKMRHRYKYNSNEERYTRCGILLLSKDNMGTQISYDMSSEIGMTEDNIDPERLGAGIRMRDLTGLISTVESEKLKLDEPDISSHSVNFGNDTSIEMTRIKINDYKPLYSSLMAQKYQYNPKLLRQLKRDIYKLVTTNEPIDRFAIADIEDDKQLDSYGVLAGVGVTGSGDGGHYMPTAAELFKDILFDNGGFHIESLVEKALAPLVKQHSKSLPIHKYIKIYEEQSGKAAPQEVTQFTKDSLEDFLSQGLKRRRLNQPFSSIEDLDQHSGTTEKKIEQFTSLMNLEDKVDELGGFLRGYLEDNPNVLESGDTGLKTNLKRLIKIYDWLVYGGKEKTPETPSERAT